LGAGNAALASGAGSVRLGDGGRPTVEDKG
jgi:hypothetical protein